MSWVPSQGDENARNSDYGGTAHAAVAPILDPLPMNEREIYSLRLRKSRTQNCAARFWMRFARGHAASLPNRQLARCEAAAGSIVDAPGRLLEKLAGEVPNRRNDLNPEFGISSGLDSQSQFCQTGPQSGPTKSSNCWVKGDGRRYVAKQSVAGQAAGCAENAPPR